MNGQKLREKVEGLRGKGLWKEGAHLEFKTAHKGVPESMWETYSAFANTGGGIILLGVSDRGETEGVHDADAMLQNIHNQLNNPQKCSCNILDESRLGIIEIDFRKNYCFGCS